MILTVLIRALLGVGIGAGCVARNFTSLIIYSDDQAIATTAAFIRAAIAGSGLDEEQAKQRLRGKLHVFPRLTLDEDGMEQVSNMVSENPGSVVVIDSLKSVSGRLGIDENSHEMGEVIDELKTCIQLVDPTSTTLLIHHSGKGGSSGRSMSDIGRGSNAITGATDNQIYIERPTAKVNGKDREVDVSPDRVITMRGRTIPESKIVITGSFDYDAKGLTSSSVTFVGDFADYQPPQEETSGKPKTRLEALSTAAYSVYEQIGRKEVTQAEIVQLTGLSQGTVSKSCKELMSEPPLLQLIKAGGKSNYSHHPEHLKNGQTLYHLQG